MERKHSSIVNSEMCLREIGFLIFLCGVCYLVFCVLRGNSKIVDDKSDRWGLGIEIEIEVDESGGRRMVEQRGLFWDLGMRKKVGLN